MSSKLVSTAEGEDLFTVASGSGSADGSRGNVSGGGGGGGGVCRCGGGGGGSLVDSISHVGGRMLVTFAIASLVADDFLLRLLRFTAGTPAACAIAANGQSSK